MHVSYSKALRKSLMSLQYQTSTYKEGVVESQHTRVVCLQAFCAEQDRAGSAEGQYGCRIRGGGEQLQE